jgi:hypothetical protein
MFPPTATSPHFPTSLFSQDLNLVQAFAKIGEGAASIGRAQVLRFLNRRVRNGAVTGDDVGALFRRF